VIRSRGNKRINLPIGLILRLFLAGGIAGFLGLPASRARAQSPAGSLSEAFVERCQAEIPGTITPTAPFPPIPQVVQSYSGAGLDSGFGPGQDEHQTHKNRGDGARTGYEQDHWQRQSEAAPEDSGTDADDDY
jgi:hypothetical protein